MILVKTSCWWIHFFILGETRQWVWLEAMISTPKLPNLPMASDLEMVIFVSQFALRIATFGHHTPVSTFTNANGDTSLMQRSGSKNCQITFLQQLNCFGEAISLTSKLRNMGVLQNLAKLSFRPQSEILKA